MSDVFFIKVPALISLNQNAILETAFLKLNANLRLLAKYGVVSSRMRATLANVEDVPVDIRSFLDHLRL